MSQWSRPASGFRFKFAGVKLNSTADALPPDKYAYAANVRAYEDDQLTSRPQLAKEFTGPNGPVISLEATLGMSKVNGDICFNGTPVDSGYSITEGSSLTPFRPNASPNAFEYVWDSQKSGKIYIPPSGGNVVQKVGIAEPQSPVDYGIENSLFTPLATTATNVISYVHTGTAGGITDTVKVNDTVAAVFQDPALPPLTLNEYTVQTTSTTQTYQVGEFISIGTPDVDCYQIKDVYPALVGTVSIIGIYYYAGSTGRCVVVPFNVGQQDNSGLSELQQNLLTGIRRGALVTLGGETCYVLGTAVGVDGTISFEISTTGTHTAGEILTGQPAIKVLLSSTFNGATPISPSVGAHISAHYASFNVGTGLGAQTSIIGISNPFSYQNISYRPGDFLHVSVMASDLSNLIECKILLDCSAVPNSFSDYYYYAFRPSDIEANINNISTQLGAAQIAAQRQQIDEEAAARGQSASSATLYPGDGLWSDLFVPLGQLIRVGSDQTRSLLNATYFQVVINAAASLTFGFHTIDLCGGFSPDVETGLGMEYIIRPRSSLTGAKGNPSPRARYLLYPKREEVNVVLPTSYSDPQMDTWDIFRRGATLERFVFAGTVPLAAGEFLDNYADLSITNNPQADYNLHEPFPSIGPPITGTANVIGTAMVATFPLASADTPAAGTLSQLVSLLPGNLINVGQQVYTLWTRPTVISNTISTQTLLFQLVENAGVQGNVNIIINEPTLANQNLAQVWGPDANGVFFAVGDPLRPGFVSRTNPQNPDAASDKNVDELCPPTEPLMNGALSSGTSIVFSPNRAWRAYSQANGRYNWVEIPVGRGLAAPFCICTDGKIIYYLGKDGIYETVGGESKSITDDDLFTLFPQEGIQGVNYTYAGQTIYAPDYGLADSFRLAIVNGFLFFFYKDYSGLYRTLVYQVARKAWSPDVQADALTIAAPTTLPGEDSSTFNQQLVFGSLSGGIYTEVLVPDPDGEAVAAKVAIREEDYGDLRATKLFGDASLDAIIPTGLTVTPTVFGVLQTPDSLAPDSTRPAIPFVIPFAGELRARAMGALFEWTDTGTSTFLFSYQISYIPQPEDTTDRFQDWDSAGSEGAKWFEGFLLEADTSDVIKGLVIRDSDSLTVHDFNSALLQTFNEIQHNGQSTIAYSFSDPFIAHQVRFEPTDNVSWREFKIQWVTVPYAELVDDFIPPFDSLGTENAKYIQGFLLEADTDNIAKAFTVQSGDDLSFHVPQQSPATFNGKSIKAFTFSPPFITHSLRLLSADSNPWRKFTLKWIWQPTPESVVTWRTQPTSHGLPGWQHLRQNQLVAHRSTADLTFTIIADGVSTNYNIPNSGGAFVKTLVPIAAIKALVFEYQFTSSAPFSLWLEDQESIYVGDWGRSGPYRNFHLTGGSMGNRAEI